MSWLKLHPKNMAFLLVVVRKIPCDTFLESWNFFLLQIVENDHVVNRIVGK